MADKNQADESSYLTLGWEVTPTLAPRYWLEPGAKSGAQIISDLVRAPADTLGAHTAIVAQSGPGKSFFLGRLVEEILLQTKARCVIFDPNADFRRIAQTVDASRWKTARYDHKNARGHLPHEKSANDFSSRWKPIEKTLFGGPELRSEDGVQLRLLWPSLSVEFLAEDVAPMARGGLYHCHEFVKAIAVLLRQKRQAMRNKPSQRGERPTPVDLIDEANKILRRLAGVEGEQDRKDFLTNEFDPDVLVPFRPEERFRRFVYSGENRRKAWLRQHIATAAAAVEYISEDIAKYYFGRAKEYAAQHIVKTEIGQLSNDFSSGDLQVIDLPSFPDQKTRSLVLNSVLATIWEEARDEWGEAVETGEDERVPTFVVVDEAHNLIPSQPRGLGAEALREQFRAIAAEGRKYGLFLIVCTQRPDKIDSLKRDDFRFVHSLSLRSSWRIRLG
jgi:hypothetical protein